LRAAFQAPARAAARRLIALRGRHGSGSRLVAAFLLPQARIAGRVGVIADAFVKSFPGKRVVVRNRYPIREDGIEPVNTLIMINSKKSANNANRAISMVAMINLSKWGRPLTRRRRRPHSRR